MKEKYSTLWAYITSQHKSIIKIIQRIKDLEPSNEDKLVHLAYQMHNLYSLYEDIFNEISMCFENHIERSSGYHKNLLIRMKISIPGIRPAVLSDESFSFLGELMSFRYVFRHAYDYNLSSEKIEFLRQKIILQYPLLKSEIEIFTSFLEEKFNSKHSNN